MLTGKYILYMILIRKATLPAYLDFFARFYIGLGLNNPPVNDELFYAFAIVNFIEKYCRCKQ